MRRFGIWFTMVLLGCLAAGAQPSVGAIVNGASYTPSVSPGCLISIFGTNLAPSTVAATNVPLPTTLGTTTVKIGGVAAPLYFISSQQINAQIPFEITGTSATVVVTTNGTSSANFSLPLSPLSPGLFSAAATGSGQGLYFDANFGTFTSALAPGSTIILYAVGLGQTTPAATTGAGGASSEPLNRVATIPDVFIGEVKAQVAYAGLAPGFVGVYQLNVVVPSGLSSTRLQLVQNGARSNVTDVVIAAGSNVKNVTGAISAAYPAATTTAAFSPVPVVVNFMAKFDLTATAQKFNVVAVFESGSSVIAIDPVAGTYSATSNVPITAARSLDFSATEIKPVDLQTGLGFPGNVIPISRLDPAAAKAFSSLPFPNTATSGAANGIFQAAGAAKAGTTVSFDSTNNPGVASFAAWLQVPYAPAVKNRSTTLRLFIDGSLVASASVPFLTP